MTTAEITYFPSLVQTQGERRVVEAEAFLSQPRIAVQKNTLPLFTFATFNDNIRDGKRFDRASMLGFDVDEAPVPSESEIVQSLTRLGLSGFYHTSSSSKPDAQRWRLFIPTARPVTGDEYRRMHKAISGQLGFPVGAAAKDPGRAWFVPAQSVGGNFIYGKAEGRPANPDEYGQGDDTGRTTQPLVPSGYSEQPLNLAPSEDKTNALIEHLVANWPPVGKRDSAHMALAGTLAKLGYPADYVAEVVSKVSKATGSEKGESRASMVRRTFDKLNSGTPVAAFTRLGEFIGKENAEQISDILGQTFNLSLPVTVKSNLLPARNGDPATDILPLRDPGHVYSYTVGDAPQTVLRTATMSDLVATLCDHVNWRYVLRWNTISDSIVAVNPPLRLDAEDEKYSNADVTMVRMWFEAHGIKAPFEAVAQAIEAAAKRTPWSPIENYLKACGELKKTGAIEELCRKAMHMSDPLSMEMVRKQLIAAVRRALTKTGVKCDSVLVFKGPQGKNKTQFIEILFGAKYVKTNLSDIRSKDGVQELKGIWAVEFGELASVANADVESLKEFVSRSVDKYRPSYGRTKIDVPRNCVFFGTTNAAAFLKDETGNRRWWIIELSDEIDLAWVRKHRDEIWSEAYNAAMAEGDFWAEGWGPVSETHWLQGPALSEAEERSKEYMAIDAWAELIHDYCIGKLYVRVDEVYQFAVCGGDINAARSLDPRAQGRITRVLTFLGAKTHPQRVNGRVMRVWMLPSAFCSTVRVQPLTEEHSEKENLNTQVILEDVPEEVVDKTGPVDAKGQMSAVLQRLTGQKIK